mmetsp:Transcript_52/g.116  ORF Transcript_52/g.116 Transcript_52/m.116 type:complete len:221 (-) Transcript_52:715-1377(-)
MTIGSSAGTSETPVETTTRTKGRSPGSPFALNPSSRATTATARRRTVREEEPASCASSTPWRTTTPRTSGPSGKPGDRAATASWPFRHGTIRGSRPSRSPTTASSPTTTCGKKSDRSGGSSGRTTWRTSISSSREGRTCTSFRRTCGATCRRRSTIRRRTTSSAVDASSGGSRRSSSTPGGPGTPCLRRPSGSSSKRASTIPGAFRRRSRRWRTSSWPGA